MNKMQFGLIVSCLLLVGLILGCTGGENTYAPAGGATNDNTVQTLEVMSVTDDNWDSDPEEDGIAVSIAPRDKDDNIVEQAGTITAKLWEIESSPESTDIVKGDLVQEWTVPITKDNYGIWGDLNLEYKSGFVPSTDWGWLEVTLTTPDGKSFTDGKDGWIGTSGSATTVMSPYAVFGNCSVLTDADLTNAFGVTMTADEPFLHPGRGCTKDWSSSDHLSYFSLFVNSREDGKTGDVLKGTCGSYHEIEQIGDYCTSLESEGDGSHPKVYFGKGTYYFEVDCSGTSCDTALLIKVANIVVSRV